MLEANNKTKSKITNNFYFITVIESTGTHDSGLMFVELK